MKIGLDIDNVIANTFQELAIYFNRYMGREHTPPEVVEIMRHDKLRMIGYWFVTWRDKLLTRLTPLAGSRETIREWHAAHEIVLITSRMPVFNRQTKDWLNHHSIPYHQLHHAKEFNKYKKAGGCDVFVEDNLEECEVLADHCEKVFLMDQPWNRRRPGRNNIIRVADWRELKQLLARSNSPAV